MAETSGSLNSLLISQLSPCFGKLEELALNFYAPTMTLGSTRTTCAAQIDDYIKHFDTKSLLRLRNIRKILITWQSCIKSDYEHESSVQDDKAEHLQALREPAQRIKDDFPRKGRDVEVRVRLLYSGNCDETILKSSTSMKTLQ
jgi:hypothetical protein